MIHKTVLAITFLCNRAQCIPLSIGKIHTLLLLDAFDLAERLLQEGALVGFHVQGLGIAETRGDQLVQLLDVGAALLASPLGAREPVTDKRRSIKIIDLLTGTIFVYLLVYIYIYIFTLFIHKLTK